MPDFSKMLEQAQAMQGKLQQMQDDLQHQRVAAASGGGAVTVEADGKGNITKISIDRSVVNADDVAMLEDLLLVAVNQAQEKAADIAKIEMAKMTGGLNLPFKLPF
ncbi:MAG: YbaB/EbfC family nucleoid-associated protein [Gemmatimonadaceae bacterium]|nr:YbaB/EbfC family nucleoid-associated protein [Gemmatimonadaceae bacterium]